MKPKVFPVLTTTQIKIGCDRKSTAELTLHTAHTMEGEEPWVRRRKLAGRTKSEASGAQSRKRIPLLFVCFGLFSITQAVKMHLRVVMETEHQQVLKEREAVKQEIDLLNQTLQSMVFQTSEEWMYFNGSWYLGSNTIQSWNKSREFCEERGADLIVITSAGEQMFARETFDGTRWIGLTDVEQEGVWKWVDGSLLNTSYWSLRQPSNNYHNRSEDCAELLSDDWLRSWNDDVCSKKRFCICEKLNMH